MAEKYWCDKKRVCTGVRYKPFERPTSNGILSSVNAKHQRIRNVRRPPYDVRHLIQIVQRNFIVCIKRPVLQVADTG